MACMNWAKVWGPEKSKSAIEAENELEDGSSGCSCRAILEYKLFNVIMIFLDIVNEKYVKVIAN